MHLDVSASRAPLEPTDPRPAETRTYPEGRLGLGGVVLLLSGIVGNLIFGASTLALPDMTASLGLSTASGALVVALYSVGFAASLVLGGRLGDGFGRRTVLQLALGAVAVTSLAVAAAPDLPVLAVARALQGLASGLLLPQVLSTIQQVTSGRVRARWTGVYAAVIGAGTTLGQLSAGVLVAVAPSGLGWRLSYVVVAAISVLVLALSGMIPNTRSAGAGRLDLLGALLLGLAVTGIVLPLGIDALVPWWESVLIFLGGLLLLLVFALWERRTDPSRALMPPAAMASAPLRRGLLLTFLFFAGYGAFVFAFSSTTQGGLGMTTLETALIMLPFATGFIVASLLVPAALRRWPAVPVMIAGTVTQAAMLLVLAAVLWATWGRPAWGISIVVLVVLGVAQAFMYGPLIGYVMGAVPGSLAGLASGLFSTVQQLGFALGVPVFGVLLGWLARDPALGFAACCATQVGIGIAFWALVRRAR